MGIPGRQPLGMEEGFLSFLKLQIVAQAPCALVKEEGQFLAGRQVCQQAPIRGGLLRERQTPRAIVFVARGDEAGARTLDIEPFSTRFLPARKTVAERPYQPKWIAKPPADRHA